MRALASQIHEPAFRRSCEELADGWDALARQQDTEGGPDGFEPGEAARQKTMRTISLRSRSV
jgi:hypothetical protein